LSPADRPPTPGLDAAEEQAYLQRWLGRVSRSFALVIPWLEPPLDRYLATAYLLCRVVDNIEDCQQPAAWRRARFDEAAGLLEQPESAPAVLAGWAALGWPGLTADETALMGAAEGAPLWAIYGRLPERDRAVIRHWILEMVRGMRQLEEPGGQPRFVERRGVRVLADVADYNRYCYIVASTVGFMSTELAVRCHGLADEVARRLVALSDACGRGLQKTNIVKDFAADLARGVSYVPSVWLRQAQDTPLALAGAPPAWTARVLGDVLDELRGATDYVLTLPYDMRGYRMASLLSLLPAYQTLLVAAERSETLFTPAHVVKISRETMARCLEDARALVADNAAVAAYSHRLDGLVRDTAAAGG
jgi:farnesyl-diphosphate farnesyltransferase